MWLRPRPLPDVHSLKSWACLGQMTARKINKGLQYWESRPTEVLSGPTGHNSVLSRSLLPPCQTCSQRSYRLAWVDSVLSCHRSLHRGQCSSHTGQIIFISIVAESTSEENRTFPQCLEQAFWLSLLWHWTPHSDTGLIKCLIEGKRERRREEGGENPNGKEVSLTVGEMNSRKHLIWIWDEAEYPNHPPKNNKK